MKTHYLNLETTTEIKELCLFFENNLVNEGDEVIIEEGASNYDFVIRKPLYIIFREGISNYRRICNLSPLPFSDYGDAIFNEYQSLTEALTKETGILFTMKKADSEIAVLN